MERKGEKSRKEGKRKEEGLRLNKKYWAKTLGVRCVDHTQMSTFEPRLLLELLKKVEFLQHLATMMEEDTQTPLGLHMLPLWTSEEPIKYSWDSNTLWSSQWKRPLALSGTPFSPAPLEPGLFFCLSPPWWFLLLLYALGPLSPQRSTLWFPS